MEINAKDLAEKLYAYISDNLTAYNTYDFGDELVQQEFVEIVLGDDFPPMPEWQFDQESDRLCKSPEVRSAFGELQIAVREYNEDQAEYAKGPGNYYGWKQRDFL